MSLIGGLRYTDEQKDLDNTGGVYRLGTAALAAPGSFYAVVDEATYHAWTPKIGIQSQASGSTFVYVSATRGFKSGGFNPTSMQPGLAFGPEFAWSYEAGLKQAMGGGRVRVNAAATTVIIGIYRCRRSFVPLCSTSATLHRRPFGASKSRWLRRQGAACSSRATSRGSTRPTAATSPSGPPSVTRNAAGNRLNNAPEWSGSGSAVGAFAAGRSLTATLRGDVSWQSRVFFTPFNDAIETQAAYGLVHLRAGFEPRGRRWEMAVFVHNAGNTEYITGTANVPLPAFTARPGSPRQWGTQFTLRR